MSTFLKKLLSTGFWVIAVLAIVFLIGGALFTIRAPQRVISLVQTLLPVEKVSPLTIKGVGILGDSQADEYRADDSRGLTYASTTLNWVEQLSTYRDINFGQWGNWSEPRRMGFAYNWARTGATTNAMLESGQVAGLSEQVRKKEVNIAIISIGANDFAPYITPDGFDAVYNGTVREDMLLKKKNRVVADITTAVESLQKAGEVKILLILIPDWGSHFGVRIAFPLPDYRQRVTSITNATNEDLEKMAKEKGIVTIDPNIFYRDLFQGSLSEVIVGDLHMNALLPSDDPRSVFLEDGTHAGTILNGLYANYIISKMNSGLGTSVKPFTSEELMSNAGL